jgi:hypothetical protein
MRPYDDFQVSTIEDLDPELTKGEGLGRKREFALGGMLLLLVLMWASWQVWTVESQRESYRLGGEAAGMKRWDEAYAHYTAASGYKDADSQAAEIAETISARDRHYSEARDYARREKWANSLLSAREVLRLEPGYQGAESITELQAQAEANVYTDALSGTIALRTEADPPGLYYRAESGWVYLEGSDLYSRPLGVGSSNRLVYDAPGEGWQPPPDDAPGPDLDFDESGSPGLRGRRAMFARFDERITFGTLALDPAEHNLSLWGERGVWAFRVRDDLGYRPDPPVRNFLFEGFTIDYQAFDSIVTATLDLPYGWSLLDLSPDGRSVLLANWSYNDENESTIDLYVADADGTGRRLLYSHKGGFAGAQFSPDGRYALLRTYSPIYQASTNEMQATFLFDLVGESAPRTLEEGVRNISVRRLDTTLGGFLQGGVFDGWVLLVKLGEGANELRLINPAADGEDSLYLKIPSTVEPIWGEALPDDKGVLLYANTEQNLESTLTIMSVDAWGHTTTQEIPFERSAVVQDLTILPGRVAYGTEEDLRAVNGYYAVYSFPLSELGKVGLKPTQAFTTTLSADSRSFSYPMNLGANLVAYTRDGTLHARTYDGKADVTLESGVAYIDSLRFYETHWHRFR